LPSRSGAASRSRVRATRDVSPTSVAFTTLSHLRYAHARTPPKRCSRHAAAPARR
jgi:hypothetical protein